MPELNTSFAGTPSWLREATPSAPDQSFLKAYETAQERNSPLYQLKLDQAQQNLAHTALQMENARLENDMSLLNKTDYLQGMETNKELASAAAKVKDWSDPGVLAEMDAIYAKRPTKTAKTLMSEYEKRADEAVKAKDRSERTMAALELSQSRSDTAAANANAAESRAQAAQTNAQATLDRANRKPIEIATAEEIAGHERKAAVLEQAMQHLTFGSGLQKDEFQRQLDYERNIVSNLQGRHPPKETFASKVELLANAQKSLMDAQDSGNEDAIRDAQSRVDAARAFAPRAMGASGEGSEPVVKIINGVKVAYVPGSKNIHIVPNETSKRQFLTKAVPQLIRDGIDGPEAVKKLTGAWESMNTGDPAATTTPTALPPPPPGKVWVKSPQGTIGSIPVERLNQYLQQPGWTKAE